MAIENFEGKNIQDTFQRVVQTDSTNQLADGTGSIFIPVSSSHAITASHALFAVSASHEITFELSSSHAVSADTASFATNFTASGNISASGTGSFSDGRFTGNVGIGTTSPAAKLHTIPAGSIGWSSLGNAGILIGTDTGAGIGIDQNEIASKGDHLYLGTVTANKDLILRAGGTTNRLVVKGDTGNVGIGTSSPGNKLEVNSGATNVAGVFKSSDNQAWISVQDDDSGTYGALFGTDSDEGHHIVLADRSANKRLVIDSSGNVGIGITTPTEKLQVTGNISASGTGSFGMINGGFF